MQHRFGPFTLATGRHLLFRNGDEVHLSPKAFRLLEVLLERRPQALSKDDLHALLWPGTFVSESNLAGLIAELRAALEDRARDSIFIRTLHAFGYSFIAEATTSPDQAPGISDIHHSVSWEQREVRLFAGKNIIGRDPADIVAIDDQTVSRQHAIIEIGERAILTDNSSKNGTFVNGNRVSAPIELESGDVLHIGAVRLVFHIRQASDSTVTMHQ